MRGRLPKLLLYAVLAAALAAGAVQLLSSYAFEPLLRWALPRYFAQHGGYQLGFAHARLHPWRLAVEVDALDLRDPDGQPMLAIQGVAADLDAAGLFKRAWVLEALSLVEPDVQVLLQRDGRLNWLILADQLAGPPEADADRTEGEPTRFKLRHFTLQRGRLAWIDRRHGDVRLPVDPIDLDVEDLSTLPEDRGVHTLSARLADGATLRWRGDLALNPLAASGDVALGGFPVERLWPYLARHLDMAPPKGQASLNLAYRVGYEAPRFDLQLDKIDAKVQGLALRGPSATEPAVTLDTVALSGGRLDLARREVQIDAVTIGPGRIAVARDATGRLDVQAWLRQAAAASTPSPAAVAPAPATGGASAASAATPATRMAAAAADPASAASAASATSAASGAAAGPDVDVPWRATVRKVQSQGLALRLTDHTLAAPLTATLEQLQLGFGATAEIGAGAPAVQIDQLGATLSGLQLASEGIAEPWFELPSIVLADARLSTATQEAVLGSLTLTGGRLRAGREADGRIALAEALAPASSATPPATPRSAEDAAGWRFKLGRAQAKDFALALTEASVRPTTQIDVVELQASAEGLSQDLKRAVPVALSFRLKSGGQVQARGQLVPGLPSADLRLAVSGVSLAPARPYVAQATTLLLAGGAAATQGRLRVQPDRWSYDGGVAIDQLQLNHADTGDRFLRWDRLSTPHLVLAAQGVRMQELTVDGLGAELKIYKDRTLNVAKIMKGGDDAAAASPAPATGDRKPPFGVQIERVSVRGGELDFADLSLALPFGTRIHDLSGQLVGLRLGSDAPAQLELEGKVDEFGLAQAAGQLHLFDPTAFTDVKVVFRNVEMTTLTPYSATFAGRRIQSGKLSLDLEYKIKDRQLAGENQVVMDQLTLGERVESPTATNLPLDLAIAILQDAEGRIDLGLPVSGSLDDPQFSYGQIVWKAIVNVLTKIVTAPFRALGALLGGNGEQTLDRVAFGLGRSDLLPPEREKLAKLAKALVQRPRLAVTVQAGFDAQGDADALRALALRRAVALQEGRTLAADEDPGSISTAAPATQAALEQLYTKRFGAEALAELRRKLNQANPAPPPKGAGALLLSRLSSVLKKPPPPLPAEEATRLRGADLHALILQRLLEAETVDETRLRALADARARAVQADLAGRGVAAARVRLEPAVARPAEGGAVGARLGIAVGAAAGPPAASASAPAAAPTSAAAPASASAAPGAAASGAAASAPPR